MDTRFLLLAVPALFLSLSQAAEPIGVNSVVEKMVEFSGREITVTGMVDRVSTARRMVILIDASEATCQEACERKTVIVRLPDTIEMPAKGSFLTASGTLVPDSNPAQLAATTAAVEKR